MSYFLVIGLGSMGKRRIRNLKSLGYNNIIGFDNNKVFNQNSYEVKINLILSDYAIKILLNKINL